MGSRTVPKVAQKYLEALKAFATSPNQKTLILPVEAAGVLGSLAGIAEIADAAFGRSGGPAQPPPAPWGNRTS